MPIFVEDYKTHDVIQACDGYGFPLTKQYRLKSGVTRDEAKAALARVMETLGEEIKTPKPAAFCVSAREP